MFEFMIDREYLTEVVIANTTHDRMDLIDMDLIDLMDLAGY